MDRYEFEDGLNNLDEHIDCVNDAIANSGCNRAAEINKFLDNLLIHGFDIAKTAFSYENGSLKSKPQSNIEANNDGVEVDNVQFVFD